MTIATKHVKLNQKFLVEFFALKGYFIMNILICDDEYKYIEDIKKNVENFFKEISQSVCFDTYTDGEKVLRSDLTRYDIAFLDIEIGNVKGTQIAEKMKFCNPHTVIFFITAFNHYLDDAMTLSAFRYLSKPLDTKRLLKGLKIAIDMIDKSIVEFMIKDGDTIYQVHACDIIFIEIMGRFTKVATTQGVFMSTNPIEFWQKKLSATYFYRIHKSFIINSNYISKYTRDNIVLSNKYNIPIAYRTRASFRQYFLNRIEELQK